MIRFKFVISLIILTGFDAPAQVKIYDMSWKKDGILTGIGISLNVLGITLLNKADKPYAAEIAALSRDDVWSFDRSVALKNQSLLQCEWSML